jgi:hypothetical protein
MSTTEQSAAPKAAEIPKATITDPITRENVEAFIGSDYTAMTELPNGAPEDRGDVFEGDPTEPTTALTRERDEKGRFVPKDAATEEAPEVTEQQADATQVTEDLAEKKTEAAATEPEVVKDNKLIPRARLNEEIEKRRKLEAKIAELESKAQQPKEEEKPQAPAFDFDAKEAEYIQLLANGEIESAAKLRVQINFELRKQITDEVTQKAQTGAVNTINLATETQKIETLADQFAAQYPQLDADNAETYDHDAVADIQAFYTGYTARGMSRLAAFEKATRDVIKLRDFNAAPAKDEPAPTLPGKGKAAAVSAAKSQPPSISRSGVSDSADKSGLSNIDVQNLTPDEFDRLPLEAQLRLRGDFL